MESWQPRLQNPYLLVLSNVIRPVLETYADTVPGLMVPGQLTMVGDLTPPS